VKRQRCFVIRPFFAEGIRKSREPLAPLAQRTILALDVGRTDAFLVWLPIDGRGVGFR
jgi:hypothetical protein